MARPVHGNPPRHAPFRPCTADVQPPRHWSQPRPEPVQRQQRPPRASPRTRPATGCARAPHHPVQPARILPCIPGTGRQPHSSERLHTLREALATQAIPPLHPAKKSAHQPPQAFVQKRDCALQISATYQPQTTGTEVAFSRMPQPLAGAFSLKDNRPLCKHNPLP